MRIRCAEGGSFLTVMITATAAAVPAIQINELRVDYGGFVAVDDVSLSVPPGEIFGLVGPNGAGKTSTFRVLATLMEPTYGEVKLAGIDIFEQPENARRVIGYMPDLAPVPSDLKVWEFLDLFAESHGLGTGPERMARIGECLTQVSLLEKSGVFCKTLSRGQTQRLVLAKTLLHRPRVLILDEPASGMDPLSRRQLRLALRNLAADGATIIVSSHILSELAEMCTSLCVMNRGKLLASGTVDEVRKALGRAERTLTLGVLERVNEAAAMLGRRDHVTGISLAGERLVFQFAGSHREQAQLVTALIQEGFLIHTLEEQKSTFEEILVEVAESGNTIPSPPPPPKP
ncbi:MAG: ABC transporter ATP-binding protein [Verrucomicrobiaceae bacterium]|nr:MAG: ABC transporter ATP-binding protein [Verrucomicrobiaceae bacterium]